MTLEEIREPATMVDLKYKIDTAVKEIVDKKPSGDNNDDGKKSDDDKKTRGKVKVLTF